MTTLDSAPIVALRDPSSSRRWFGAGVSVDESPRVAAVEATSAALTGSDPRLVVVFCSPRLATAETIDSIRELTPGVPMIGCTTNGEIGGGVAGQDGLSVSILGGDGFVVDTTVAENAAEDLFAAGARAATVHPGLAARQHQVVLLLSDALAGNQQDVVRGAFAEVGASVPVVGGCAGDGFAMTGSSQFHDGRVLDNAIVSAAIGSDSPMGIGVRHGWTAVGEPMVVTRSAGTSVQEINGEPALDVYAARLGAPATTVADPAAFTRFSMTHPLGLRRRNSEEVRFVSGADHVSRSLTCVADVPEGSLVWVMEGDTESILEGTTASCADALDRLEGREPIGALAFDCVARRDVLGAEGLAAEWDAVAGALSDAPVGGFYTYGEFARTNGVRGFHNQTLVTLAFS